MPKSRNLKLRIIGGNAIECQCDENKEARKKEKKVSPVVSIMPSFPTSR